MNKVRFFDGVTRTEIEDRKWAEQRTREENFALLRRN
jgi:hypothetical protein